MKNKLKGLTLIETVLYIGLFSAILFIVMNFMLSTQEANNRTSRNENIHQSSQFVTQHITETFYTATSVDEATSTFENNSGVLSLVIGSATKTYDIQDHTLYFDNVQISSSNISVETFYLTPVYKDLEIIGVKVDITLRDKKDTSIINEINLLATFR